MSLSDPSRVERIAGYSLSAIFLVASWAVAIWARSLFVFALVSAFLILFVASIFVRKHLRISNKRESTSAIDEAAAKPSDDPRRMGRYVP
jgi:uncharacterized protein (DUF58 family)